MIKNTIATGNVIIELSGLKFPVITKSIRLIKPADILIKAALLFIFQKKEAASAGETDNDKLTIPKTIVRIFEKKIAVNAEIIAKTKINLRIFLASFSSFAAFSFFTKSLERLEDK